MMRILSIFDFIHIVAKEKRWDAQVDAGRKRRG